MKTLLSQNNLVFNPPKLGCVLFLPGLPGGSSTIYDRSPYGNHGTITGATWARLLSGLWYLDFDGIDDDVDLGTPASLQFDDSNFSLETWFKTAVKDKERGLFDGQPSSVSDRYCARVLTSGKVRFYVKTRAGVNVYRDTNSAVDDDKWHHIVCTGAQTGGVMNIYLDGVTDQGSQTGTLSGQIKPDSVIRYGAFAAGNVGIWKGELALGRIYADTLSASQAKNHYNQEKHLFGVW